MNFIELYNIDQFYLWEKHEFEYQSCFNILLYKEIIFLSVAQILKTTIKCMWNWADLPRTLGIYICQVFISDCSRLGRWFHHILPEDTKTTQFRILKALVWTDLVIHDMPCDCK